MLELWPSTYPAERLPDGLLLTTHHAIYGLLFALFGALVVWDDYPRREPLLAALAALVALIGFVLAWRVHPVTGATLALCGTVVALSAPLTPLWTGYPYRWRAWVVFWALVALDDVVSHALGWPTPLDTLYQAGLYRLFP